MMKEKTEANPNAEVPAVRELNLMGTRIPARGYRCARDGGPYLPKPDPVKLQLSILLTRFCGARCFFCIAAPTTDPERIDPERLRKTLLDLREADCVRGISITGGEPFTDPVLLDEVISLVFGIFGYGMEVTLDTNGSGIRSLGSLRDLYHLDTVHISRHHWDDARNDRIFGRAMPTARELQSAVRETACPDLFVLNCMLLRGGVETPEDARRYLDFALETGAGQAAFITADPVNAETAARRVDYEDVLRDGDPSLLFTRGYRDFGRCRCRDGVYVSPRGQLIRFYGRCTLGGDGGGFCRGLVIEPDGTLRAGFRGPVIAGKEEPLERE